MPKHGYRTWDIIVSIELAGGTRVPKFLTMTNCNSATYRGTNRTPSESSRVATRLAEAQTAGVSIAGKHSTTARTDLLVPVIEAPHA